jgi:hypothetical protein
LPQVTSKAYLSSLAPPHAASTILEVHHLEPG